MKVFVRLPDGNEKSINVRSTGTINDVKVQIHSIYGIKPCDQSLVFCDKVLEDKCTLDDYGIIKESTIRVVVNLNSGCDSASERTWAKEVVLPGCIISLKVLEQYLRDHVDSSARIVPSSEPDVVGIVVVNTDEVLTGDQLRDIINTSERVSEQELGAWVAEYCVQQQRREAEVSGATTKDAQIAYPWIDLVSCELPKQPDSAKPQPSACDINPVEYSDESLQDHWIRNKTAVDCEVRLSRWSPAHRTVARIDSMSAGCFISRKLQNLLEATPDEDRSCSFQLPNGVLKTKGTAKLLVYWKNVEQQMKCAKVEFNVPEDWLLPVDVIVTVPMAVALGFDKIARGVPRDNMLAANERIFGRISFRSQDKKAKVETERVNAVKAKQNSKDEAEWFQRHEMLRHPSQPYSRRPTQIPAS